MSKSCPKGQYYCYTDKKCKKIPKGYMIGARGYLRQEPQEDDSKKNGNGNGNGHSKSNGSGRNGSGNGNGNSGGNGGSGGVSEATMTSSQKRKDTMLKKKYDDSDMKQNMKKQYGKEKGEKVYYATIRKQAMESNLGKLDEVGYYSGQDRDPNTGLPKKIKSLGGGKKDPLLKSVPYNLLRAHTEYQIPVVDIKVSSMDELTDYRSFAAKAQEARDKKEKMRQDKAKADKQWAANKRERVKKGIKFYDKKGSGYIKGGVKTYNEGKQIDEKKLFPDGFLNKYPNLDPTNTRDFRKLKQLLNYPKKVSVNPEVQTEGKKKGLWDNIHAKRKRGEKPAKKGDKDYPKTLNVEGMKTARKNVGASTCWDGYKAKGTKKKGGKEVPNCVKEGKEEGGYISNAAKAEVRNQRRFGKKGSAEPTGRFGQGTSEKAKLAVKRGEEHKARRGVKTKGMGEELISSKDMINELSMKKDKKVPLGRKSNPYGKRAIAKMIIKSIAEPARRKAGVTKEETHLEDSRLTSSNDMQSKMYADKNKSGKKMSDDEIKKEKGGKEFLARLKAAKGKMKKEGTSYGLYKGDGKPKGPMAKFGEKKKKEKKIEEKVNLKDKSSQYARGTKEVDTAMTDHVNRTRGKHFGKDGRVTDVGRYRRPSKREARKELEDLYKKESKSFSNFQQECWKTHKKVGMKMKGGKLVNDCRPKNEEAKIDEGAAWTKKAGKSESGGLNEKGRKSYERENPGSDLKAPSKKVGNKRRTSFCARMKGMRKRQKPSNNTGDDRLSKSLRKWNC